MIPIHLKISVDHRVITWTRGQSRHQVSFDWPVMAIPFADGSGIAIVNEKGENAPDNAEIINEDGSSRKTVKNPEAKNGAIAFSDVYYVGDELTLIISFQGWQMACVINSSGDVIRTYETR